MENYLELFRSSFYILDFAVGGLTPVAVYVLYRLGLIDGLIWRLFWIGCGLGLTWEVPMQVLNELVAGHAVHVYTRPPPVHFSAIIISHSLWDGGLFLLGVVLVRVFCGKPLFQKFRSCELAVLVLWGQASELWVELTSIMGEAWSYVPGPWNPSLFIFNGRDVTLLPQLIWLAAPIAFYLIALYLPKETISNGEIPEN